MKNNDENMFVFSASEKMPHDMSWEELLSQREHLNHIVEEYEAGLKVLSDEFLFRLNEQKINGTVVGNYSISKSVRYGFDTTFDEAKELGAIKPTIDQAALKALHLGGKVSVPGVRKTEFVTVREVVKNENKK
jgi:threonine dehydrogenase-like Zn-dependent dehydrogenase